MLKFLAAGAFATLTLAFLMGGESQAGKDKEKDKAKHTIAQVMGKAMKGGLCGKVAGGKASDEEKAELVELFTSLSQNTPPKGDAGSWKEKTGALLEAAKKAAKGDEAAGKALKAAANCAACHKEHKG